MLRFLYTTLLGCLFLFGFSQTEVTTSANVTLRDSTSSTSEKITVIPQGTHITIGDCNGGWCETEYNGYSGYVSERYVTSTQTNQTPITTQETHSTSPIHYYTNTAGNQVQSPTHYDNGPPSGATAQCNDGTYSFSQSRRGTCSHHGGVSRWF